MRATYRNNQRNLNVQGENIQAQDFHCSFGVSQRAYGSQHGEKRLPSTKAMANIFGDNMDGQYGCAVMDHKPRASLEGIRWQPGKENRGNTKEIEVKWKYWRTEKNLADLGSRGDSIDRMQKKGWFTAPGWILNKEKWPQQPELKQTPKATKRSSSYAVRVNTDEWDDLLKW